MKSYYDSIKGQRDATLARAGYRKYRKMDDVYANKIRKLWEIVELKEVKKVSKKEKKLTPREAIRVINKIYQFGIPQRNLCKIFKMEDKLQAISFNKKYNNPKYSWILYEEYDYTSELVEAFSYRIVNINNVVIVVYGPPNSGKSERAQTIADFLRHKFKEILDKEIQVMISFSSADLDDNIINMEVGDVIIRDETPKLTGKGSHIAEWNVDNILKMIRLNQNNFIFVDPKVVIPDVVDFYLETAGKWKKGNLVRFILYVSIGDKNREVLGHVYIPMHEDKEIRDQYEKKKKENIQKVKKDRGKVEAKLGDNKKQQLEIDYNEIELIFKGFKWDYDKESILNKVLKSVENKWKNEKLIKRNKKFCRDIILKGIKRVNVARDINLNISSISGIVNPIEGTVNRIGGLWFEPEYYKYLKNELKPSKNYNIRHLGSSKKPDITMEDLKNNDYYIFCLKNLKIKKYPYTIQKESAYPEYKEVWNNIPKGFNNIFMYAIVFNNFLNELKIVKVDHSKYKNIVIK